MRSFLESLAHSIAVCVELCGRDEYLLAVNYADRQLHKCLLPVLSDCPAQRNLGWRYLSYTISNWLVLLGFSGLLIAMLVEIVKAISGNATPPGNLHWSVMLFVVLNVLGLVLRLVREGVCLVADEREIERKWRS